MTTSPRIAAVILAAGQSSRMGRPKLVLPWGETTVIGQVVSVLLQAGIEEIVASTGGARPEVETALAGLPARAVFNPHYLTHEMLSSFQVGLSSLPDQAIAALAVLGDQPQIEAWVVKSVVSAYLQTQSSLVVPSYQMRRGHPWLVDRRLWPAVLDLQPPATLRDFINQHEAEILYINVETDSILRDIDTPADYESYRPK